MNLTTAKLHGAHSTQPFKAFRLNLADGRLLDVRHPEMLACARGGRTDYCVHDDGRGERADLLLVVSIDDLPAHPVALTQR